MKCVLNHSRRLCLTFDITQDEYRLPEGMKRVGYDADSGRYTFQDRDGSLWVGAEGAEFSEMTRSACSLIVVEPGAYAK